LRRDLADPGIDRSAVLDHGGDQLAGQRSGGWIAFRLSQMSLEDGLRRALAKFGFEDRGERESTSGGTTSAWVARGAAYPSASPLSVSLRRHRR
jgi:hypothetical protein